MVTSFLANGRVRPTLKGSLTEGTMLQYKSYGNGMLHCGFRRSVTVPQGSELYMLDLSENQYALWAVGPLASDNLPAFHRFFGATPEPIDIRFVVCQILQEYYLFKLLYLDLLNQIFKQALTFPGLVLSSS